MLLARVELLDPPDRLGAVVGGLADETQALGHIRRLPSPEQQLGPQHDDREPAAVSPSARSRSTWTS